MNGKGDRPRNCYSEQYRENYDAIFRMNTKKIPPLHELRPIRKSTGASAADDGRKQAATTKARPAARTRVRTRF